MDSKVRRYNGKVKGARLRPPLQNRTRNPDGFFEQTIRGNSQSAKIKLARADGLARANGPRCCCVVIGRRL